MEIRELCEQAHTNARAHGFWDDYINANDATTAEAREQAINNAVGMRLMQVVRELSEALEELRDGDKMKFRIELADVFIRMGDLIGGLRIDIEPLIITKMRENILRPYKHGKKF